MPTRATASRVRAIYPFVTHEKGELSFEKGDVIKVIDRMYDEWYTGAVGGRIGIFPVSYVVGLSKRQDKAHEEASDALFGAGTVTGSDLAGVAAGSTRGSQDICCSR